MEGCVKSLGEDQVNSVSCLPSISQVSYFVVEDDQVCQAWFAPDESMLAFPTHMLQLTCGTPQEYLLCNFPSDWREANGYIITRVLLRSPLICEGDISLLPVWKDVSWCPWLLIDGESSLAITSASPLHNLTWMASRHIDFYRSNVQSLYDCASC